MNTLLNNPKLCCSIKQSLNGTFWRRAIICEISDIGSTVKSSIGRLRGYHHAPVCGAQTKLFRATQCIHRGHCGSYVRKEVTALQRILQRSGLYKDKCLQDLCFKGARHFTTSANFWQQQPGNNDGKQSGKEDEKDKVPTASRIAMAFWMLFLAYAMSRSPNKNPGTMHQISWNEFVYDMLAKGEVAEVIVHPDGELAFIQLHPGAVIKGRKVEDIEQFSLKLPDVRNVEEKVRKAEADLGISLENGVPVSYSRMSPWLPIAVMAAFLLVVLIMTRNIKFKMPNPSDILSGGRKAQFVRVDLQPHQGKAITFKDVAGLHEAKVEVMEFLDIIKHPERFKKLGGKAPKGALLLGPPGCGKTLLAKALAHECQVPFLAMAGSEFVEMVGGLGASRVRDLFKEARQKAPCIIYIDEIDAIGRKRSGDNWGGSTEEEHTLNQMLVEMDGMSSIDGVIVISSTNRADILDKALLRPGRFDRHIMIDYPTLAERKETFTMYLHQLKLGKLPATYYDRLAELTPGMTGADIANVCNEAALHAARVQNNVVGTDDFEYAIERVLAGVAKKSTILSGQEKKMVAYHEAGHALVSWLLEHTDSLLRVSIVPRTSNALGFAQYLPSDKHLHSKEEIFERVCMMLGGRVAESLTFNKITSGAEDDLKKVTKIVYQQIRQLGMNENIGLIGFPTESDDSVGTRPYSKYLSQLIDQEARQMIAKAYKHTEKLMLENKEKLRMIAEGLLEKEVLTYKDMEELIGPPTHTKKDTTL